MKDPHHIIASVLKEIPEPLAIGTICSVSLANLFPEMLHIVSTGISAGVGAVVVFFINRWLKKHFPTK